MAQVQQAAENKKSRSFLRDVWTLFWVSLVGASGIFAIMLAVMLARNLGLF
jgi:hypothetical protein